MNCLHCGKKLPLNNSTGWHKACIKRFFGTKDLPTIDINKKKLELLADKGSEKGYTIPGVQKKLSLQVYADQGKHRLTIVDYPTGYILKPQVEEFEALPQAEHLTMHMAAKAGIETVPNALILDKKSTAYITKRIDRVFSKDETQMLAMEDFCQLDLRLTQDKYKGSYERCVKIIQRHSSRQGLDIAEFFIRLVFSYLVGNSDMHLKNFSLIETSEGSGDYVLSPAYDLLPVNIIMPEDKEEFALTMRGKKTNIRKNDFLAFAQSCGIEKKTALKIIEKLIGLKDDFVLMCEDSFLPETMKDEFKKLIVERAAKLS
ncbi:MAG: HipA domain-containing protein [Clostridiales bacterium]|nr:HipA domain-containing protein [Clostridiales bacterium]